MNLRPNAKSSLYMTLGSTGVVVNDGFVRRAADLGLNVYQVLFLRSLGIVVLLAAVARSRGEWTQRSHLTKPVLARVATEVLGATFFFAAIVQLDFANAQAILQVVPFAVALAAAVVLGERVSGRQYFAVAVGFVGVLIIVRPATAGFSAWSLMALAAAGFLVAREFATRSIPASIPGTSIAFLTALGLAALTGVVSAFGGWGAIDRQSMLWIALAMLSLSVGYWFTIETVRIGDLNASAPFRYTILLGAVVIGFLMFDEVPDTLTVIGVLVIVASGLYSLSLDRS